MPGRGWPWPPSVSCPGPSPPGRPAAASHTPSAPPLSTLSTSCLELGDTTNTIWLKRFTWLPSLFVYDAWHVDREGSVAGNQKICLLCSLCINIDYRATLISPLFLDALLHDTESKNHSEACCHLVNLHGVFIFQAQMPSTFSTVPHLLFLREDFKTDMSLQSLGVRLEQFWAYHRLPWHTHIDEMYKPRRKLKFWHALRAECTHKKRTCCKEAPLVSISVKQLPERLFCKSCFLLPLSLKRRWQMKRTKLTPPSLSTVSWDPRGFLQPNAEWFLISSFVEYYYYYYY